MSDKNEAMQQALELIERLNQHGWILADFEDEVYAAITALKAALEQPDRRALQAAGTHPAPCARHCEAKAFEIEIRSLKSALKQAQQVQEPVACRFCHSKKGCWTWQCDSCGEIDDVQQPAPLPVQEPVGDEWTPCMKLPVVVHVRQQRPGESHVSTREGITPVKPDDLIMRGVSGEEYPIGRAIFEQTYSLDIAPSLPVQRQPLTDEEIKVIHFDLCNTVGSDYKTVARAIEAAHNIKEQP